MTLTIPGAPPLPGLSFRFFGGDADYARMAEIYRLAAMADHSSHAVDADEMAFLYAPAADYDPYTQVVIAEADGAPVAYSSVRYAPENDGSQVYRQYVKIIPAWQRQGLGCALLRHNEALARTLAARQHLAQHSAAPPILEAYATENQAGAAALLGQENYLPVRYFYEMVRPNLEDIPDAPLPPSVEVRPVQPEHYRQIWEADQEAFADSWGMSPPSDEAYETWLASPFFDPTLWRVAWADGQVVGQVRSTIVAAENESQGRLRGYTDEISVRSDWRRRGLATALIYQSLRGLREAGMTEAALAVDADNPDNALRLYERCGFRVVERTTAYRKPMDAAV